MVNAARRKLVAGNWKMNGLRDDLRELAKIDASIAPYRAVDVAVAPPFTAIVEAARIATHVGIGAQDCHWQSVGAHTGSVSATMVKDAGADLVILGHSERRDEAGERSSDVRAKALAAMDAGLVAIICVGERKVDREFGNSIPAVMTQLEQSVPYGTCADSVVIAYEPVWAIGTGLTPTAEQIEEMHAAIRSCLTEITHQGPAVRILYGGSVTSANAPAILAIENVDGALVGGASLTTEKFLPIVIAAQAASEISAA